MKKTAAKDEETRDSGVLALIRAIVARDAAEVSRLLGASPDLARDVVRGGATRGEASEWFFEEMTHYVYAGDTALHVAAAAHQPRIAAELLRLGATVGARNRRGAEPLHYAADGSPGSQQWNPEGQAAVVKVLLDAGADPNAADKSGVAPLHRAVRTRCAPAVAALLAGGADPLRRNGSGTTPLHLAVQTTGRGGSGSPESRDQQTEIIALLLRHGARPTDVDASGKTIGQSASAEWVRELLSHGPLGG